MGRVMSREFQTDWNSSSRIDSEAVGRRLHQDIVVLRLIRQRHEVAMLLGKMLEASAKSSQCEPSWWLNETKSVFRQSNEVNREPRQPREQKRRRRGIFVEP